MAISWADLSIELLTMIADCIKTRIDKTRFRSVCSSWRSSTPPFRNPFQFSIDLHSATDKVNPSFVVQNPGCFHTVEKTIYCLEPLTQSSSSVNYWLIAIEESEDGKVHLLNPFTGLPINQLPSGFPTELNLDSFHIIELQKLYRLKLNLVPEKPRRYDQIYSAEEESGTVRKVIFLPNPTYDEPLLAVLQTFGILRFFKLVNKEWLQIHETTSYILNIASYKGKVYAIGSFGETIMVDSSFNKTEIAKPFHSLSNRYASYLVESSEDLYLVEKYMESRFVDHDNVDKLSMGEDMGTKSFLTLRVYKLDHEERRWVEVSDIGGQVMILDEEWFPYWSFCVSAHQIPGFKRNCIFFTDNATYSFFNEENEQDLSECYHALLYDSDYKLRVFDMETRMCGSLMHFPGYADMFWPPPNWLNVGVQSGYK